MDCCHLVFIEQAWHLEHASLNKLHNVIRGLVIFVDFEEFDEDLGKILLVLVGFAFDNDIGRVAHFLIGSHVDQKINHIFDT